MLVGILSFSTARFVPLLATGASYTWLYGVYIAFQMYGSDLASAGLIDTLRKAFAVNRTAELTPVWLTGAAVWLLSYSAFSMLGRLKREKSVQTSEVLRRLRRAEKGEKRC